MEVIIIDSANVIRIQRIRISKKSEYKYLWLLIFLLFYLKWEHLTTSCDMIPNMHKEQKTLRGKKEKALHYLFFFQQIVLFLASLFADFAVKNLWTAEFC